MIDAYFRSILAVLGASPVVQSHDVAFEKRGPSAGYVRGTVFFADESQLHFREFVNAQAGIERFTYVYHCQAADGSLIFRYDNTPHYPDLPNAPHHRHDSSGKASGVPAPDLEFVLQEIELLIGTE